MTERDLSAQLAGLAGREAALPDGPIYRRLADGIQAEIERGALPAESRLPTVRQLAHSAGLAHGTVKHAYDELERRGMIEKIQGRGTFVRDPIPKEAAGNKAKAMEAIEAALDRLEELGFSSQEIRIFWDLKLRERFEQAGYLRIAVIDCNPEALRVISEQVAQLGGTEVQRLLLGDLLASPHRLDQAADLLVTTPNHYAQVAQLAPENKILRVVLSPSRRSVAELARLGGLRTGVMTKSERFAGIIRRQMAGLSGPGDLPGYALGGREDPARFLAGLDAVILPDQHGAFCSVEELEALRAFRERGGVVAEFRYRMDAGSLMFLEQRVAALLEEKAEYPYV